MRLSIRGWRDDVEKLRPAVAPQLESIVSAETKQAFRVDVARSLREPILTDALQPTDVIEVELEDGLRLWFRADEAERELGAIRRRGVTEDVIEVPATLRSRSGDRGVVSWMIRALRVLVVKDPVQAGAEALAPRIAAELEERLVPKPGLFRWRADGVLEEAGELPTGAQALLFLHGTASHTLGSFGGLATLARSGQWTELRKFYGEHIYALEHRTLSVSPIENALDVVKALPKAADLHLVSHSRGGLIGELLCRGHMVGRDEPFTADELKLFDANGQARFLAQLGKELAGKRPNISRFVRVACPARGTTLADERLDRWLSILTNLIGLVPGLIGSEIYEVVKAFLLAVVKERANPRTIPGLEAMIPDSPFQKLINHPGVTADAALSIIKGDLEGTGILGRLKTLATDLYYREDHDLVVNTSAMDGGVARRNGTGFVFDRGPDVNHFSYFINDCTAKLLVRELTRPDTMPSNFEPVRSSAIAATARSAKVARGGAQPTVFVLPGIMGSLLNANRRRVWIDIPSLSLGGLDKLRIGASGIEAGGLVSTYYRSLVDHLADSHQVIPFPYDWRLSIRDEAVRFTGALRAQLAASPSPVRIVAHSMGGLVARAAFAAAPDLWQAFKARDGARFVMLGVPNGGSHGVAMMLMSRDQTMHMLAALDFTMDRRMHLEIACGFPGVLDLLPEDPRLDLHNVGTWQALQANDASAASWVLPDAADLERSRAFRDLLRTAPFDPRVMVYVAGRNVTVDGIRIDKDTKRIEFTRTQEGDGRVPWSSGILPGMSVWYTDASHGDLARHRPAFQAIADLLERGTTTRLPSEKPRLRDLQPAESIERERMEVYPTEEDLAAAAMGARIAPREERQRAKPIRLSVTHGNLAFARHPLLIGHYSGDTISGPEAHLDHLLDRRLTRWRELGLYPGAIGTAEVILGDQEARSAHLPGAIVIGLGDAGQLTGTGLEEALTRGLLRYAAVATDHPLIKREAGVWTGLKASALLVGSGAGGLPITAFVTAFLGALQRVRAVLAGGIATFEEVEVMELYEHRAIQAWHLFHEATERSGASEVFVLASEIRTGEGGRRRVVDAEDRTWWLPMTVTMERFGDEERMKFTVSTNLARAEAMLLPAQKKFVDRFVQQATAANHPDRGAGTPGRTLFELLLPDSLKEQAQEDRNLRLILDPACAAYPWELLDDRRPWLAKGGLEVDGSREPPVARGGLIRQLIQQNFRERAANTRGPIKALIIGDPRLDAADWMPPLDGAVEEAKAVAALLKSRGVSVLSLIEDVTADEVVMALCAQDWQIVHIAAHGVIKGQGTDATGVVLGKDLILSAKMFAQLLPVAPRLVFVNCCHLGNIGPDARVARDGAPDLASGRNQLAANVAVELIDIGVAAVVAAGWAVDDQAAKLFAESFYGELFHLDRPRSLGEATRIARQLVYRYARNSTTWGAYQVYGEPDWRADPRGIGRDDKQRVFASVAEAVYEVDQIFQDAQTGLMRDPQAEQARLGLMSEEAKTRGWLGDPQLLTSFAAAYGELGQLDEAIKFYEQALGCEKALAPIRAIEQLSNLLIRKVVRDAKYGVVPNAEALEKTIVIRLRGLQRLVGKESVERYSLVGAFYKRLAQIVSGPSRDDFLRKMERAYANAAKLRVDTTGREDPYPLLMKIAAQIVLKLRNSKGQLVSVDVAHDLDTAERVAWNQDRESPHFWHAVACGDALLLRHLAAANLDSSDQEKVINAYYEAWRRGGSRLKLSSVFEQIEFLVDVLGGDGTNERVRDLRIGLVNIRDKLERRVRPEA